MMQSFFKEGIKVSIISILVNFILAVFKFIAGIIGKSNAMLSDSIHSLSDVLSTIVVIVGLKLASKDEDKNHPYGHERIECIVAIILSFFLFIVGFSIGWIGLKSLLFYKYSEIKIPTTLALIAAIISIVTKEIMFWYTRNTAKKIRSDSLMADAWHHRSDALSSVGSFIGIGGAMLGFKFLDSIASIIICLCIIKVGLDIFIDSTNKIIDKACCDNFINELQDLVLSFKDVKSIDSIKTRLFGNKIYIDIEISADANLSLYESHQIAEDVHDSVEEHFQDVKHCMVHMNPKV